MQTLDECTALEIREQEKEDIVKKVKLTRS